MANLNSSVFGQTDYPARHVYPPKKKQEDVNNPPKTVQVKSAAKKAGNWMDIRKDIKSE